MFGRIKTVYFTEKIQEESYCILYSNIINCLHIALNLNSITMNRSFVKIIFG